jgi:hypothetical protein
MNEYLNVFPMLKPQWDDITIGAPPKFEINYSKFIVVTFTTDTTDENKEEKVSYKFGELPKERKINVGPVQQEIYVIQAGIEDDFNDDSRTAWARYMIKKSNIKDFCKANDISPERIKEESIKTPHVVLVRNYSNSEIACLIRPIFTDGDMKYKAISTHATYCSLARKDYTGDHHEFYEGNYYDLPAYKNLFTLVEANKVCSSVPAHVPVMPAPVPVMPDLVPVMPTPKAESIKDDYVHVQTGEVAIDLKNKLDEMIKQRDALAKQLAEL